MSFELPPEEDFAARVDQPHINEGVWYCSDPDCDGHGHPQDDPNGDYGPA